MNERHTIHIEESEIEKPIGITPDGRWIRFSDLQQDVRIYDFPSVSRLELPDFDELSLINKQKLVLERLKYSAKNLIEYSLSGKRLSFEKRIKEVEDMTEEGKKIIEMEIDFLKRLKIKYDDGEIEF